MKNNYGKATALVIGSLMICSVRAVALSSNDRELANAKAWGESQLLVTQASDSEPLTEEEKNDLVARVASCSTALSETIAAAEAASIPETSKDSIVEALTTAKSFLAALAQSAAEAQTKGDADAIAQAQNFAKSVLGPAFAQAQNFADSPGGKLWQRQHSRGKNPALRHTLS